MLDDIIKKLDYILNNSDIFKNRKPSLFYDRYYAANLTLTQIECMFLKNVLEDVKEEYGRV